MDKSWMQITDRLKSSEYADGVKEFISLARSHANGCQEIRCPCTLCSNNYFRPISEVERHLFIKGIDRNYTVWIFHGEEEYLSLSDDDDLHEPEHDGHYIDDIDHMLEDIRAGKFIGVPSTDEFHAGGSTSVETESTKCFDQLLVDAMRPLYEGCTKYSKLSFIVKLLHIKTLGGWSIKSFDMLLQLLKSAFPNALFPNSYQDSRNLLRGLGFTYTKIHACPNDCILYWKENADKEECPKCKLSRWIFSKSKQQRIPQKVLRHFPLKPRLQRLFMSQKIATEMRWHREQRVNEHGVLRHPADSEVWASFDEEHAWFAQDSRNVRLGLASDGFNPFNNLSKPYSIWPVILVSYNLPPWLCMKDPFFITSLLIPGPRSPGNDIDVYLQPLIDELIDLWENGVHTYDAMTGQTFRLHAALLWTINDFPAYGNLSGWSTKGKMACPLCRQETDSMWLTYSRKHCYMGHRRFLPSSHIWRKKKSLFNGSVEHREPPKHLSREDIINEIQNIPFDVDFGKANKKRKCTPKVFNWTKKSIFFQLPYWSQLKIRHNLNVMHIEKNICDNILGTLMNITGKTKDHVNSRRDLSNLNIRKELQLSQDGQRITMPHACFTLCGGEKTSFCNWLNDVKFPDGFASNLARCVSVVDCKISGMKSHDCHIFMQRLLPVANGPQLVPPEIWAKLCARWSSEGFKRISERNRRNREKQQTNHTAGRTSFVRILEMRSETDGDNLVDFFKDVRWSKKKGTFVTPMTEEKYNLMVAKMSELEPEKRTKEAAAEVFREVLGHRSGYARGLSEMVIPESSRQRTNERIAELSAAAERHEKDAEYYKRQLEELRGDVRVLLERQAEYDKFMTTYMSERQSQGESHGETQGPE